jgi:hypothetical protein
VPSLDWLEPLGEDRYRQSDLPSFGVPPGSQHDDKLAFSLLRRPAPYTRAPSMMLLADSAGGSDWDDVMHHVARWLTRHLNDPALVLWLAKRGGKLHRRLVRLIEQRLDDLGRLQREGKGDELKRIRANAPNAIPEPPMRAVWRLLLTRRVKAPWRDLDLYRWKARLTQESFTTTLRLELRELLTPKVLLKRPFRWKEEGAEEGAPKRLKDLLDWELVLTADHVYSSLRDLAKDAAWLAALPAMFDDFQQLLRDALDLLRELGEADDKNDRGHWHLPSISSHSQNRGFTDWVALIEVLRDAWVATQQGYPERARRIVLNWLTLPYPTFKRLALYAATFDGVTPIGEWVDWLLADEGWWLWSVETRRETMRLLVLKGAHLPDTSRARLEMGILAGPPRPMFRSDIEPERWRYLGDHSIWMHLAKLASGGGPLGDDATARLAELTVAHPEWKLAANESDEFSHWMTGTGDPEFESQRRVDRAPRRRRELMAWLQHPPSKEFFDEDNWRELCQKQFPLAACALCGLARANCWPPERWREALQAWSEERFARRSWRYLAPVLQRMPDDVLLAIERSATWWVETASKVLDHYQEIFLDLCRRFLRMSHEDPADQNPPVIRAINHPVGQITQALLHHWYRREPKDDQGLPDDLKALFTALCDIQVAQYRHGRVLLATHVISLFRVDREWATAQLLPRFKWELSPDEAQAAWEGFLWSPRLYRPLLVAFKDDFLTTARHYAELGEHGRQYATILTYAALDPADTFTTAELYSATSALPQEGLEEAAQILVHALQGAGEEREQYWHSHIRLYWQTIWPKSRQLASKNIAERLAHLAVSARSAFPSALETVRDWLQPLEHPYHVIQILCESGLCGVFPQDALTLLDAVITNQFWAPVEINDCLTAVAKAWPEAHRDGRFQRLMEYARQHGQG